MGAARRSTLADSKMHTMRRSIGNLVAMVLNREYLFGKDRQKLNNIYAKDKHDGYVDIHNITRQVKTIIMEDNVEFHINNQGVAKPFLYHINIIIW